MHDAPTPVLKESPPPKAPARHVVTHEEHSRRMVRQSVPAISTFQIVLIGVFGLIGLGILFALGLRPQQQRKAELLRNVDELNKEPIRVAVTKPVRAPEKSDIQLPGEIQAVRETTLYARTSGYIKRWLVDMGDNVKAGQLLAEIDAPEVDMQLERAQASLEQSQASRAQAQAALEQAKAAFQQAEAAMLQSQALLANAQANAELADLTTKRYTSLRGTGGVTEQEISDKETAAKVAHTVVAADEAGVGSAKAALNHARAVIGAAEAAVTAANANVSAAKAEVRQAEVLKGFERVVAPFDGRITARNIETGTLVNAGSGTNAQALFHIVCNNPVRVFINVPQTHTQSVRVGQQVQVFLRETPDKRHVGTVTRTANAIDASTRTLKTEIEVANADGALLSGMYAQVNLNLSRDNPPLMIPGSALIVNSNGTQVALVQNGHIHFQPVVLDGDYGVNVGVASGISTEDTIVANPGERLIEGCAVNATSPSH